MDGKSKTENVTMCKYLNIKLKKCVRKNQINFQVQVSHSRHVMNSPTSSDQIIMIKSGTIYNRKEVFRMLIGKTYLFLDTESRR